MILLINVTWIIIGHKFGILPQAAATGAQYIRENIQTPVTIIDV